MDSVNKGAVAAREAGEGDSANCVTIGILPTEDTSGISEAVDVPVVTGMGSGRNNINALTGDVMIACGMGLGTASEIALALKVGKKVILLGGGPEAREFFIGMGAEPVSGPEEAIEAAKMNIGRLGPGEQG
jgi:uncharacterized protein (TIGR00725 family)